MYCKICGRETESSSCYCSKCSGGIYFDASQTAVVSTDRSIFKVFISALCAFMALLAMPVLFGGAGVYFGCKVMNESNKTLGVGLVAANAVTVTAGLLTGAFWFIR